MEAKKKKTMSKDKLIALISQEKEIHPNDVRHVIQAFLDKAIKGAGPGVKRITDFEEKLAIFLPPSFDTSSNIFQRRVAGGAEVQR